jgi:hypothetical protein
MDENGSRLLDDPDWHEVTLFLRRHADPLDPVMAPNTFLDVFPGIYHYHVDHSFPPAYFKFVVIHEDCLGACRAEFLQEMARTFHPVLVNPWFVIFARGARRRGAAPDAARVQALLERIAALPASPPALGVGIVVTTYDRPWYLARSLPQIVALGRPVIVVDDGSDEPHATRNRRIAERCGAGLLRLPANRGLCCAHNVGVSYWLADPSVSWISVFQDDVDVRGDLLDVLAKVQDPVERPYLTGRYDPQHAVVARDRIAGVDVLYQRSARLTHGHAHRDYWRSVLPVPTPYLGSPKPNGPRPGQGSEADWWVASWSPDSVVKRGGHVVCVPGLVRHAAHTAQQSTWGGAATPDPDPPLGL